MSDSTVKSQVKAGFRRAGAWLLGWLWAVVALGGVVIAFTPTQHPRVIGWILLAISAVMLILTMDRWVGAFSALLAYGIIGGIATIISGHAVNNPAVKVPRIDAVIMTMLIAGSAVVSYTFTKRKLKLPDRIALFGFVFCFFWQVIVPRYMLAILGLGFLFLLLAWAYDRFRLRGGHSRRPHSPRREGDYPSARETPVQ